MIAFSLFSTGRPPQGISNILADGNNHAARIPLHCIPTTDEAVDSYLASGGSLSPATLFGTDPLSNSAELLYQRQQELEQNIPSPEENFAETVNGNYSSFAHSLTFLIDTTNRLRTV